MRTPLLLVAICLVGATVSCAEPDADEMVAAASERRRNFTRTTTQEAVGLYAAAVDVYLARADRAAAAYAASLLGDTWFEAGRLKPALEWYTRAVELAVALDDRHLAGVSLASRGITQALMATTPAHFDGAVSDCARALEYGHKVQSRDLISQAQFCRGEALYSMQRPVEALEAYRESGAVLDALATTRPRAVNLIVIGQVQSDLARQDEARQALVAGRQLAVAIGDRRLEAIADLGLAKIMTRRGEYQAALEVFQPAVERLDVMGDDLWLATGLLGIAEIQSHMGDGAVALRRWQQALALYDEIGLLNIAIDVRMSLGKSRLVTGDRMGALADFEDALQRASRAGIPRWEAIAWHLIGLVHLRDGAIDRAGEALEKASALHERLGADAGYRLSAATGTLRGELHRRRGEFEKARGVLEAAMASSHSDGDRLTEATGAVTLARVAYDRRDYAAASSLVSRALALAESMRADVLHRDLRRSWAASIYDWYGLKIAAILQGREAVDAARVGEAFRVSEQSRARTLVEALLEPEGGRRDLPDDLIAKEQELLGRLEGWSARRAAATDAASLASLGEEYSTLVDEWQLLDARMRAESGRRQPPAIAEAATIEDVQTGLLDEGTLLLEFVLAEPHSFVFAIGRHGAAVHALPPRDVIESAARRLYDLATGRLRRQASDLTAGDRVAPQLAQEAVALSRTLLGDIDDLAHYERLMIVADGALHYVPFSALHNPDVEDGYAPLLITHEVVAVPSATAVLAHRRSHPGPPDGRRRIAVLADPVFQRHDPRIARRERAGVRWLPNVWPFVEHPDVAGRSSSASRRPTGEPPRLLASGDEAIGILQVAGGEGHLRALGFDATRELALSPDLADHSIVHFATHAYFDNGHPGASGIMLSRYAPDGEPVSGFVSLHDIYALRRPVDLVVLSACDTALGEPIQGEGLVGIVRAFMDSGARSVVASLWKVDDAATGELMRRFYSRHLKDGLSVPAALRAAQLELRQDRRWNETFFWAAFVVQGA